MLTRLAGWDVRQIRGQDLAILGTARWLSGKSRVAPEATKPESRSESGATGTNAADPSKASQNASRKLDEFALSRVFGGEWAPGMRGMRPSTNARPWKASELRLKSTEDLHRLWFVMTKEKLALLSERDFCRRNKLPWKGTSDLWKLRKGMARLKTVVGERFRQKRISQGETEPIATQDLPDA
jgi:large subunit ribosomal protein L47